MNRGLLAIVLFLALPACTSSAASPCPCPTLSVPGSEHAGAPRSSKLDDLARQRVELARKRLAMLRTLFDRGTITFDVLFTGFRDVAFAARDSGLHGETLRHILTDYRDGLLALQTMIHQRAESELTSPDQALRIDALVAEAEYWLAEANE
jgi:hypothetical protein